MFDVSAVARRTLFQPRQDLGTVETVLSTETVRRQAIANDQLRHRPHVHFEHLGDVLGSEYLSPRMLMTAINRQGTLFLWPVRLPGADGKIDTWSRSAMDAAEYATKQWVRVQSNMSLGAYEVLAATADLPEPEWPATDFRELLRVAFRDRHITSADHPVIQRLRGLN